jgi:citronellol/citronellal dehydrogenase
LYFSFAILVDAFCHVFFWGGGVQKEFGAVDILINNASALWWQEIEGTPLNKYDLITSVNSRASFYLASLCVPLMKKRGWGRVVCMSPPIFIQPPTMVGKVAYNISKFGMTLTALGVAQEYGPEKGILANSLWPATVIESQASINFELGERKEWRKATILADAVIELCRDSETNGKMLIDDTYLRSRGWEDKDFVVYRYDPSHEPTRYLDPYGDSATVEDASSVRRGDVREVQKDKKLSSKL